jgi:hypothetical protein
MYCTVDVLTGGLDARNGAWAVGTRYGTVPTSLIWIQIQIQLIRIRQNYFPQM